MIISVVTTLYESQEYVLEFYKRIKAVMRGFNENYEMIFVNDGSTDQSSSIVMGLIENDYRIKLVELSRNFGHHEAIMEGIAHASGDLVFLIDCDLEEPPEALDVFHKIMIERNCDVVYGVQKRRKGGWFEKVTGNLFYRLINVIGSINVPHNLLTLRLMSRSYVDSLLKYNERVLFIAGVWASVGFKQIPCVISKKDKGSSSYSMGKKITLAVDSITSFSAKPLSYVFMLGLITSFCSFLYFVYILVRSMLFHSDVEGWTSLIASIWLFGGLTLLSVGIVGAYIGRIFVEVKGRPRAIVKSVFHKPPPKSVDSNLTCKTFKQAGD